MKNHKLFSILMLLLLASCNNVGSGSSSQPDMCSNGSCDFSYALNQNLYLESHVNLNANSWGPWPQNIQMDPSLIQFGTNQSWLQNRILATMLYWVGQKPNYCHHHVPTWMPPLSAISSQVNNNVCSTHLNIYPGQYEGESIRWNYSGVGSESQEAWYSNNGNSGVYLMGMDCSDYSSLAYNFGLSIVFSSAVALQAGQESTQSNLAPNMPGFIDWTGTDGIGNSSAGQLVCADGSVVARGSNNLACASHGGYISVYSELGAYNPNAVTDQMLENLKVGDLVYIAGCANPQANCGGGAKGSPLVTHVVMWTGQKIGQSSIITNQMIAPQTDIDSYGKQNSECESGMWSYQNNPNQWIISDSHYQGADFRAFTSCFYRNQVWGVRRVIN